MRFHFFFFDISALALFLSLFIHKSKPRLRTSSLLPNIWNLFITDSGFKCLGSFNYSPKQKKKNNGGGAIIIFISYGIWDLYNLVGDYLYVNGTWKLTCEYLAGNRRQNGKTLYASESYYGHIYWNLSRANSLKYKS